MADDRKDPTVSEFHHDGNGVRITFNGPSGEANPIMTPEQFQWLLEYIAFQCLMAVQDHEYRVHEPMSNEAAKMLKQNMETKRRVIERLKAIFVKR